MDRLTADTPTADMVIADWTITLLDRAFRDLAAGFGTVDPVAADRAIFAIETMVAAEMTKFCDERPEGIAVEAARAAAVPVVMRFRETAHAARAHIQQAAKPRN